MGERCCILLSIEKPYWVVMSQWLIYLMQVDQIHKSSPAVQHYTWSDKWILLMQTNIHNTRSNVPTQV
jgi:hypothetical protein